MLNPSQLLPSLLLALSCALPACSDDPEAPSSDRHDAGVQTDTGGSDTDASNTGGLDAADQDAGSQDAGDQDVGFQDTGDEAMATATFGDTTATFDRAFYGLTAPAASDNGRWEIHLEAHAGGAEGCPTQDSPTPRATLIVGALPLPETASGPTWTAEDGVAVSLLDFDAGLLDGQPFATASSFTATLLQADVCTDCLGQPSPSDPDGVVRLSLEASFEGGMVSGEVIATHCDSMDLQE